MAGVLSHNVSEMEVIRVKTKREMYKIAEALWMAHSKHDDTRNLNAYTSLASNVVGLSGLFLAPFSGGLSLVVSAAATGGSAKSMLSNHWSCNRLSAETKVAISNAERAMREYNLKVDEIEQICTIIEDIEKMPKFEDVLDGRHYTISTYKQLHRKLFEPCVASSCNLSNFTMPVGLIGLVGCNNTSTQTRTAEVTKFTQKSTLEVVNAAKLANTRTASLPLANLTYAGKGIGTASAVSCTTAEGMKVASKTVKETSTVSSTVVKSAAGVSKLGLAFSAIAIPLDIYNILSLNNTMESIPENVKKLRDQADKLGDGLEKIYNIIETFERMHMEVFEVYEDCHVNQMHEMFPDDEKYRVEKLYEFLVLCHRRLKLKHPTKYS